MKKISYNVNKRKPIWISLSEFYLDTSLDTANFKNIALTIIQSPYSLEEVKRINKYEVFPILQDNLLSVAGEWEGFNEEWLVKEIIKSIENRTLLQVLRIELKYKMFKWMYENYWTKLEKEYQTINMNQNTKTIIK